MRARRASSHSSRETILGLFNRPLLPCFASRSVIERGGSRSTPRPSHDHGGLPRPSFLLAGHLLLGGKHRLHALLHVLRRNIVFVRGHPPEMPKGILELAG